MDAISVWAERRGVDGETLDMDALAAVELDVKLGAVLDSQVAHRHIAAHEEPDQLKQGTQLLVRSNWYVWIDV